jgi:hypothetical protein
MEKVNGGTLDELIKLKYTSAESKTKWSEGCLTEETASQIM